MPHIKYVQFGSLQSTAAFETMVQRRWYSCREPGTSRSISLPLKRLEIRSQDVSRYLPRRDAHRRRVDHARAEYLRRRPVRGLGSASAWALSINRPYDPPRKRQCSITTRTNGTGERGKQLGSTRSSHCLSTPLNLNPKP